MKSKTEKLDQDLLGRLDRIGSILKKIGPDIVGHRVRRLRNGQGLSIREVADQASISKNSIVRLEQGRGTQPVTVLKICSVLGVHVERLADPAAEDVMAVAHRKKDDRWFDIADMASRPLPQLNRPLTKSQRTKAVKQDAQTPANLLLCQLPGGAVLSSVLEITKKSPVRSHVGEEFAYVLSGEAIITVGKKKFRLKEGEAVTFWSAEPHSYAPANPKKVPVRILSVRVDG